MLVSCTLCIVKYILHNFLSVMRVSWCELRVPHGDISTCLESFFMSFAFDLEAASIVSQCRRYAPRRPLYSLYFARTYIRLPPRRFTCLWYDPRGSNLRVSEHFPQHLRAAKEEMSSRRCGYLSRFQSAIVGIFKDDSHGLRCGDCRLDLPTVHVVSHRLAASYLRISRRRVVASFDSEISNMSERLEMCRERAVVRFYRCRRRASRCAFPCHIDRLRCAHTFAASELSTCSPLCRPRPCRAPPLPL